MPLAASGKNRVTQAILVSPVAPEDGGGHQLVLAYNLYVRRWFPLPASLEFSQLHMILRGKRGSI